MSSAVRLDDTPSLAAIVRAHPELAPLRYSHPRTRETFARLVSFIRSVPRTSDEIPFTAHLVAAAYAASGGQSCGPLLAVAAGYADGRKVERSGQRWTIVLDRRSFYDARGASQRKPVGSSSSALAVALQRAKVVPAQSPAPPPADPPWALVDATGDVVLPPLGRHEVQIRRGPAGVREFWRLDATKRWIRWPVLLLDSLARQALRREAQAAEESHRRAARAATTTLVPAAETDVARLAAQWTADARGR